MISIKSVFYLILGAIAVSLFLYHKESKKIKTVSMTDGNGNVFTGTIKSHNRQATKTMSVVKNDEPTAAAV